MAFVSLGKTLYPYYPVPRIGRKAGGPVLRLETPQHVKEPATLHRKEKGENPVWRPTGASLYTKKIIWSW